MKAKTATQKRARIAIDVSAADMQILETLQRGFMAKTSMVLPLPKVYQAVFRRYADVYAKEIRTEMKGGK